MPIVGLDFGTTNSVVAVVRGGDVQFLLDRDDPHPSVVWYRGTTVVVGREAKEQLAAPASGVVGDELVRSPKLYLGTDQQIDVAGEPRRAEEIVAEILTFLRVHAAEHGEPFDRCVLTIPVGLTGAGRRELRSAAHRAGLRIEQFVHEPLAALYGHLRERPDFQHEMARHSGQYMLVFDWGGGTLDVTLCRLMNGVLTQVVSQGDRMTGGDQFDRNLMDFVKESHARQFDLSHEMADRLPGADAKLWEQTELAKKTLSQKKVATVFVDRYLRHERAATISVEIGRAQLAERCSDLIDRGFACIDQVLGRAGIRHSSVALCLATGGMVRMPRIRERLIELFGPARVANTDRGDLAIARGGAWISHDRSELRLAKPVELLLADGGYVPLVRAGRALPRTDQVVNFQRCTTYCADPRDGLAKIQLVRPVTPGGAMPAAPRLSYDYLLVRVDPTARPLRERIEISGRIDHDLVLAVEAQSSLDRATSEIMDLEFGLELQSKVDDDIAPTEHGGGTGRPAPHDFGAITLRSNLALSQYAWGLIPGELLRQRPPSELPPTYRWTPRQKDEAGYYLPCSLCGRSWHELQWEGCSKCAAESRGPSPTEARARREEVVATWRAQLGPELLKLMYEAWGD